MLLLFEHQILMISVSHHICNQFVCWLRAVTAVAVATDLNTRTIDCLSN